MYTSKTVSCSRMSRLLSALETGANCSRCVLCVLRSKSRPLDQMEPLVTVDAHCCIHYYTYIQYTLLCIHTVYIIIRTYSIHCYTYIRYTLLYIHTVYITMHTYSIHSYAYLQYTHSVHVSICAGMHCVYATNL